MARMAESPLAVYQAHLENGELAYQWSPDAQKAVFYPRVICPFTGSDRLDWRVNAPLGTVYATTVTHPAREGAPYNVALIDCDEGFRVMSTQKAHASFAGDVRFEQRQRTGHRGQQIVEVVRNAPRQLPHRLHLLCLQKSCLCLLPCSDFGPQPLVGRSELPSAVHNHAFELFPVARQRSSCPAQRFPDPIQFTHSADQWTRRFAASQDACGGRKGLDGPPNAPTHPPGQSET